MNKGLVWGAVAVVVIGGAVLLMNKGGMESGAETEGAAAETASAEPMSAKELLAMSGSHKCTFSSDASGAKSEGTVYVASGKMRHDSKNMVNGASVDSHMIISGGQAYVWTSQMPNQGFKFDASVASGSGTAASSNGQVNLDQKFAFDCDSWSADQTVFNLPSGVAFSDLSTLLKAGVKVSQ